MKSLLGLASAFAVVGCLDSSIKDGADKTDEGSHETEETGQDIDTGHEGNGTSCGGCLLTLEAQIQADQQWPSDSIWGHVRADERCDDLRDSEVVASWFETDQELVEMDECMLVSQATANSLSFWCVSEGVSGSVMAAEAAFVELSTPGIESCILEDEDPYSYTTR